jgi:restriction endonuclease S subunit
MSFALSSTVNSRKVFLTRKSDIIGRWDPAYYIPSIVALEKRVRKVTSHKLRDFVLSMAGGATPATTESETHYTEGNDGIPFIRVQNLSTTGKLNLEDCKRITRQTHTTLLQRSQLHGGELLVKITGVGRMAIASVVPDGFEGNINQHIVAIRTNNIQTSKTVAAYLNLDLAEKLASRRSTGGTRPALDYPALLSIPVVFDELIPKMISAAVLRYDALISKTADLLGQIDGALLDELGITQVQTLPKKIENRIFKRRFSEVEGGRLDPLYHHGDIFHFVRTANCALELLNKKNIQSYVTGFAAGRDDQGDEEDGIIQVRPTNINDDRELVFDRNVYIDSKELATRPFDRLKRSEVLFNNTNSQEQVGKTVYFDLEGDYFCSNHITRISTNNEHLFPQYLVYVLNLYQRHKVFYKVCTNWNNQSGVGTDVLRKILIPLPELRRQEQIVNRLDEVRMKAHDLRRQATEELAAAKRAIESMILGEGDQM